MRAEQLHQLRVARLPGTDDIAVIRAPHHRLAHPDEEEEDSERHSHAHADHGIEDEDGPGDQDDHEKVQDHHAPVEELPADRLGHELEARPVEELKAHDDEHARHHRPWQRSDGGPQQEHREEDHRGRDHRRQARPSSCAMVGGARAQVHAARNPAEAGRGDVAQANSHELVRAAGSLAGHSVDDPRTEENIQR